MSEKQRSNIENLHARDKRDRTIYKDNQKGAHFDQYYETNKRLDE